MPYRNDVPIGTDGIKELINLINTNFMSVNALVDAETLKMPSSTLPAETDLDNLTVTNRRIKTFVIPSSSATIKTINGIPADYPALAGVLIEYRIDNARKIQAIFPAVNPFKWYYRAKQSTAEGWSGWISSDDALPKLAYSEQIQADGNVRAQLRDTDNAVFVSVVYEDGKSVSATLPLEDGAVFQPLPRENEFIRVSVINGICDVDNRRSVDGWLTVEFKKVVT